MDQSLPGTAHGLTLAGCVEAQAGGLREDNVCAGQRVFRETSRKNLGAITPRRIGVFAVVGQPDPAVAAGSAKAAGRDNDFVPLLHILDTGAYRGNNTGRFVAGNEGKVHIAPDSL